MLKHLKSIVASSLILFVLGLFLFTAVEPQVARAVSASDAVIITLTVNQEIAITSPADSSMSTPLGVSQNTAVGTTTWNVRTNDANGYTMALHASTTPAMQQTSTTTVSDYQTGAPTTWSVSNTAKFGYSAFGADTATTTWGTDTDCAGASAHAVSTTLKYQGFQTTNGTNISARTATTTTTGTDTTVCYAVEQNNFFIPSGTYTATITATATGN